MTFLLGDRSCMESLRKDITDLQGTVIDVFSRVGTVRYPSWKFPDKVSCDLDLVQLLERYDHIDGDPEFTQLSHVVLLELVIDRLLLLLQSFTAYTELISSDGHLPPTRALGPSMSIGLTVRKYWNNMLKLGTVYQQERSSAARRMSAKEESKTAREAHSSLLLSRFQSTPSVSQTSTVTPTLRESQPRVAQKTRTVCSQTIESSLVPCDTCSIAQNSLQEVSDAIIRVCNEQNLPCSLIKIREMLPAEKILSPNEMRYWAGEESKDLARISKHLSELMQVISPLREQLEATKAANERLQQNMESCKKQMQEQKEEQKQQALQTERRLQEKGQQSQEVVNKLERDKEELRRGAAVLEERVCILKEELKAQHGTIRDLELARGQLLSEMRSMVNKEEVSVLEQKVGDLKIQLQTTMQKLKDSEEAVSKEKARGESLQNHKESLQVKQRSLLQQLDRLAQECEDLRGSLGDADEEKTKLEEHIEEMEGEKESLSSQLEEQQEEVKRLQLERRSLDESISGLDRQLAELQRSLQEQRDREKLLVSYPELHPPPELESSGDVRQDMEKQLQANIIRINILEEENSKLRASLCKLREKSQHGPLRLVPQTQLWTLPHTTEPANLEPHQPQSSTRASTSQMSATSFSSDTLRSPASFQPERRVPSGGTRQAISYVTLPLENSPIAAYARVKQMKGRNRTPSSDRK
ncbi:coiled-coil domain-containing protein 157 [Rhinophrynus dorsalis]